MKLSRFGHQLSADSGIVDLMKDLGEALNVNRDVLFLGGGNPATIPEFESYAARHAQGIASDPLAWHKLIGVYQSPKGSEEFIALLVSYINKQFGWGISEANVAITNGSQSAFFILLNMYAGQRVDSTADNKLAVTQRQIVFPMMPEYLGYADQGVDKGVFKGYMPRIEYVDEHVFKYHVDFDALSLDEGSVAMCVSRPTNPTGNVLEFEELKRLSDRAEAHSIPLIVDCAYGDPFPGIHYTDHQNYYSPRNIYVLSCSKLGLPGARTGIVIADEKIIHRVINVNTIITLANGNFGPAIMSSMIRGGQLPSMCRDTLLPFYRSKKDFAVACVTKYFVGLPYYLHSVEGAFFLWLWFKGLPVTSTELYERMKQKGVLIMDGAHFFFGIEQDNTHRRECIRITYCQNEAVIEKGIQLLALELKAIYS